MDAQMWLMLAFVIFVIAAAYAWGTMGDCLIIIAFTIVMVWLMREWEEDEL